MPATFYKIRNTLVPARLSRHRSRPWQRGVRPANRELGFVGFLILCLLSLVLVGRVSGVSPKIVPIKNIEIFGAEKFSDKEVRSWLKLKENAPFSQASLYAGIKGLLQQYADRGFPYARVDSVLYRIAADSSGAYIKVYLRENKKVQVGRVDIIGVDSVQVRELKSRFELHPGDKWDTIKFEADLDDALTQLENRGYPFGRFELKAITLDSINESTDGLGLKWRLAPGPQLVLNEVQIVGNKVTKKSVILREIRFKPGEIYNRRKVDRITQRLMRTGFFSRVDEPEVFVAHGNEGGLLLRVEEGKASRFDGVVGYTPGVGEEKGYFTGLIDISLGNLFGTGRSLLARWQKRDQKTQDLKFYYREPWVAGWPLSVGAGFDQLIQDTTYVQRDWVLDLSLPLLENLNLIAGFTRMDISPDSVGSFILGIPQSRTLSASIGIDYDTRDDLLNPRRGVYYQTTAEVGKKRNLGPAELIHQYDLKERINNRRLSLDMEFYAPLFKRQVLALSLHGRQLVSSEKLVPISDTYRLGGARTLRGYREDQFRGTSVAWTNLEFRYILGRRSRVFLFLDNGYYQYETLSGKNEALVTGYGFGFRLETGLGIMGIDYGLGKGDGLFNGKVHVGLINEF